MPGLVGNSDNRANSAKDTPQSFINKHLNEKQYEVANFTATVTGCFKDCVSCQISEGLDIHRSNHEVLNSKAGGTNLHVGV